MHTTQTANHRPNQHRFVVMRMPTQWSARPSHLLQCSDESILCTSILCITVTVNVHPRNIVTPLYMLPPALLNRPSGHQGITLPRVDPQDIPNPTQFRHAAANELSITPICNIAGCYRPAAVNDLCQTHATNNNFDGNNYDEERVLYLFRHGSRRNQQSNQDQQDQQNQENDQENQQDQNNSNNNASEHMAACHAALVPKHAAVALTRHFCPSVRCCLPASFMTSRRPSPPSRLFTMTAGPSALGWPIKTATGAINGRLAATGAERGCARRRRSLLIRPGSRTKVHDTNTCMLNLSRRSIRIK